MRLRLRVHHYSFAVIRKESELEFVERKEWGIALIRYSN